ncbi:MAG: hypothetical protein KDA74_15195, partial [Planctomycetaceae bacterium]|nr:hypothetical protein [Planctomycetaceae bacterium]
MNCANSATEVQLPFLWPLIGIFFGWLILPLIFSRPLATGVKRFLYFGVPLLILGGLLMIPLAIGALVVLCWVFYLLFRVLQLLTIKDEWLRKNLLPFGVNAVALTLSFVLIFVTTSRANSTPGLIASLGKLGPHSTGSVHNLMSRLIERGPEVVAPLSAALERDFERSDHVSPYRTVQIAYCLRTIGGAKAEAALKETVAQRVTFQDRYKTRWETAVCYLYAESARERAVPTLMNLLNSAEGEQAGQQKLAALLALTRTQAPEAVETVLDHADFLKTQRLGKNTPYRQASQISVTLQALAEGQSPADLSASPVYEPLRLGLNPDSR